MQPWNVPHQKAGDPEPKVNPDKVTVYNMRFCPYAQRTMLTLLAKGVPFEVVNINLKNKPDWFVEKTWGTVSVVRYKGHFIMESLVNSDFIDEQFPEKQLHPKDPIAKAEGRLLVEKLCKFVPFFYKIVYFPATPEERKGHWDSLLAKLGEIDAELKKLGTPFFGGEKPSMTDYMIWPWIERLPILRLCHPDDDCKFEAPASLANYKSWVMNMLQVDAVKTYGLTAEQHLAFREEMIKQSKGEDFTYDFLL